MKGASIFSAEGRLAGCGTPFGRVLVGSGRPCRRFSRRTSYNHLLIRTGTNSVRRACTIQGSLSMLWTPTEQWALMLSTFAGLSTTIGAVIAIIRRPEEKQLAFLLGIAIGVMFTLSLVELWVRNAAEMGWISVTAAVVSGGLTYQFLQPMLPDFRHEHDSGNNGDLSSPKSRREIANKRERNGSEGTTDTKARQGTGGGGRYRSAELLRLGFLMALTMTLHNLPEGLAVAFASFTDFGPIMAVAIAVHNIPEGIIVAAPVYAATSSRWKALGIATLSGLSEPLGALIALLLAKPLKSMTGDLLPLILAFVGGIMSTVCVVELWPEGRKCNEDRQLFQGILLGSVLMGSTLYIGV